MPSRKRHKDLLRAPCADLHEDDGVDPRDDKRRASAEFKKTDRKLRQLCKQVETALNLTLPGLAHADELIGAIVARVMPAPDAGRLRVTIELPAGTDPERVAAKLDHCSRFLRSEVARAVSRRRAPELVFCFVLEGGTNA